MLVEYQNGDFNVIIDHDGTKIREWRVENPKAEHPESVDMKITDYCDLGCPYCHERSTVQGKHARIENIERLIEGLPAGVEIALGGGNPLSIHELPEILTVLRDKGLIPNMTVNEQHLNFDNIELIKSLRHAKLLFGLGVSYDHFGIGFDEVADDNTVAHMIVGIHQPHDLRHMIKSWGMHNRKPKVLLLGYKRYGRGDNYHRPEIDVCIDKWRYFLPSFLASENLVVSFDNLALEQLGVRDMVDGPTWMEKYMGDDGQFTMYVDAVNMEFARSSVNRRMPVEGRPIVELFREI